MHPPFFLFLISLYIFLLFRINLIILFLNNCKNGKIFKTTPHVDDDIIKEGMNKYKHHKNPYVMISRSISHRQSAKYIYYRNKRMFNLQGRNPIGPIPRLGQCQRDQYPNPVFYQFNRKSNSKIIVEPHKKL
ncbi:unnamed protein product [Rhizophagus irregularis]|nr:unnamed protein product [Rhizophagus irregularis]CAB5344548.1 unnamed protein product [Rhizophagus irregularis]